MPYVSNDGTVVESRDWSLLSFGAIPELFWGAVEFVSLFFRTLINPNTTRRGSNYSTEYRAGSQRPPAAPQRRIRGVGRFGAGGPACPPMAAGG